MLEVGKIYSCEIVKLAKTYAIVKTSDISGILHISEISDYHISDITKVLELNKKYNLLLISIKDGKYNFSYKQINPKLLKVRSKIIPTPSGFKNIHDLTLKLIKNN
jgi:predicted RNA-binding protein with RPS1 domain